MKRWIPGFAICVLILTGSERAVADLIQNGGFETGDFTDWTLTPAPSFLVEPSGHGGIPSHSGSYHLNIGSTTADPGIISQTVSDMPGSNYTLSMWLLGDGGPNFFSVKWNGTAIYDMAIPDTLHVPIPYYIQLSFVVQGTGSDTVTLSGGDDGNSPGAIALDDVSLVPGGALAAPEPSSLTLVLGVGILGLAAYRWRRRKPDTNGQEGHTLL
jgi:PEP-CTERM motif